MKKIFFDYYTYAMSESKTAWSKARLDCGKILKDNGYQEYCIFISRKDITKTLFSLAKSLLAVKEYSNVIIQYPLSDNSLLVSEIVAKFCKMKRCKLTLLIHDINSLRYTGHLSDKEINILRKADNLIVHNDSMRKLLQQDIPQANYFVLQSFDYFIDKQAKEHIFNNTVVYAGNLQKSKFLIHAKDLGVKFNLYGASIEGLDALCNDLVQYKGAFEQNDLSIIEGDWGLVWDGTSIETCNGIYGEYLKYNAPHKLSLYFVANLPVIIWDQAAEAQFIVENQLGIAIHSLSDIKMELGKVTLEEYKCIKRNVTRYSIRLTKGENLTDLLTMNE